MSKEYGNDFITLQDENGVEYEFEHIGTVKYQEKLYMGFVPAEVSLSPEEDLVILRLENEDTDDEVLVTVEDDTELEAVYEILLDQIDEKDYYEQTEDETDDEAADPDN